MIVQPNIFNHHKTRQLITELGGDELAPLYVLRLWAHCQSQKKWRFPKMSATALFAITCANSAKTSPEQLWLSMQSACFIRVIRDVLIVHQWEEYNAGLVKNWDNGRKGGRPKKPNGNPKPVWVNPKITQTRFGVTDRLDRIEKIECVWQNKADTHTKWPLALPDQDRFELAKATNATPEEVATAFETRRDREIKYRAPFDDKARSTLRDDLRKLVKARRGKASRKPASSLPEPPNWKAMLASAPEEWLRSEALRSSWQAVLKAAKEWALQNTGFPESKA
jgi:hypothetical protein